MKLRSSVLWAATIAAFAVLLLAASSAPGDSTPATQPASIKAVWFQPRTSFTKWKQRGINTLWGYEAEGGSVSLDKWCADAQASGFSYVLQTDAGTELHWTDPQCVAVHLGPDEPNSGIGAPNRRTAGQMTDAYVSAKARTNKPIVVTLSGWNTLWQSDAELAAYLSACDQVAFDYYVINRGEGPSAIQKIAGITDRIHRLAPGKVVWVCIECGSQHLDQQSWLKGTPQGANCRAPTPLEMAQEVDDARSRGGCPLLYFPQDIGASWIGFDSVTPDLEGAMQVLNRK